MNLSAQIENRKSKIKNPRISVIIPALDEERSIGRVLGAIPEWVDEVVVVDNGSTDRTAAVAAEQGARVVSEPRKGYGSACLAGLAALDRPGVVVFLDADFSDDPAQMRRVVEPIRAGRAEMVIGSRMRGQRQRGALTPVQLFGNRLACGLIGLIWRYRFTDLGPFRAIRWDALQRLNMDDRGFGWTVQMQTRAARRGLRAVEVPVSYRRRVGVSKISGTLRGVLAAGSKILYTIFREAVAGWLRDRRPVERDRRQLIVFTRFPEPGRTKTRMIPALGEAGAADLQRRMTRHTLAWAKEVRSGRGGPVRVEVRFAGGDERRMAETFGTGYRYRPQGGGDLGERMARAFRIGFEAGDGPLVTVGSDCPGITGPIMEHAFNALRDHDLVLGPARDEGYYLIGLRRMVEPLFEGVGWGTGAVLEQTLAIAERLGLRVRLLDPLDDVDRPEDLRVWREAETMLAPPGLQDRVSVIVPALNEEAALPATLERMRDADVAEVIVADGGSRDGTAAVARSHGARVVLSPPGRAVQMNAGAAAASGDILIFCHADTLLPEGFERMARAALARPGVAAGAFELGIDTPRRALRRIEAMVNWRSHHWQMPYGDQAIFMRAKTFRDVGGYPRMPVMEDYALVARLRRRGRIAIAPAAVRTSGRFWMRRGAWRATLVNRAVVLGYQLGVSPSRLARWRMSGRSAP